MMNMIESILRKIGLMCHSLGDAFYDMADKFDYSNDEHEKGVY